MDKWSGKIGFFLCFTGFPDQVFLDKILQVAEGISEEVVNGGRKFLF
jgi:hypothetical protein